MRKMPSGRYPRYVSVYDSLLGEIQAGKYKPGDRLPSEMELAEQHNVSRNTLRQALLILQEDGFVTNHQGKGNFVMNGGARKRNSIERFNDPLQALAVNPVDEVTTQLEIRRISPKHQATFGMDASKLLVFLEMVYLSGGKKIGCALVFIPYYALSAHNVPLDDMDRVNGFYQGYIKTEGFRAESVLRIAYARDPVTTLLEVPQKHQMLMLDEVIYAPDGQVAMTQKLFFLPDDYEFTLTRKNDGMIK